MTDNHKKESMGGGKRSSSIMAEGGGPPGNTAQPPPVSFHVAYGNPIHVKESRGKFPRVGSTLGPYFCLGQLGKGTFSSVHKCINMAFYTKTKSDDKKGEDNGSEENEVASSRRRLAAAKVELRTFHQSGVLDSEATILHFLHSSLPPETVPVYMGHFKSSNYAAIVMEYLPGEDMNQLRETIIRGGKSRRLHVKDAVYLTADVLLPLLQRMHSVGFVHRDVKPSNAVRMAPMAKNKNSENETKDNLKKFCLVDFGLSKSVVVPRESPFADSTHPWPEDQTWLKPAQYNGPAFFRKEREKADFRGSSMYASLRVHQGKDYCPRDDVWSVMYVFCDLVSGGLPWMSHAANKERNECGRLKEIVQGERPKSTTEGDNSDKKDDNDAEVKDEVRQLLMGDEYHVAKHRQEFKQAAAIAAAKKLGLPPPPPPTNTLPTPLPMSEEPVLVGHLRKAFDHLATLQFWDSPNYDLIRECIHGFLEHTSKCPDVPQIQWEASRSSVDANDGTADTTVVVTDTSTQASSTKKESSSSVLSLPMKRKLPSRKLVSEPSDPACLVNTDLFGDAQDQAVKERENKDQNDEASAEDFTTFDFSEDSQTKLPIHLQFGLEQMAHHARNVETAPKHIVLRDWLEVVWLLVYQKFWDVQQYEESHRTKGDDGFRRPYYLKLLRRCVEWARAFDDFHHPDCFFHAQQHDDNNNQEDQDPVLSTFLKRRRRTVETKTTKVENMIQVSKAFAALKITIRREQDRRSAPPMRLSFGT